MYTTAERDEALQVTADAKGRVMRLYLVQHGKATSKETDPARPLTEEGVADADYVGTFLAPSKPNIPLVQHSGKLRAQQTAEILAKHIAPNAQIEARDGLAPNDDVQPLAGIMRDAETDLMLVGHLPFMNKLASLLLAGDETAGVIDFKNAGVVCLERIDEGEWDLLWDVIPELV